MSDAAKRLIAHADMDAFYAAVEQLDDPGLRGRPILVGPASARGVVLTASYEARPYGVGSAMPMSRARRLCPDALVVPPRFERYKELSERIMHVFADFSPRVEALSLDEAFLDMSGAEHVLGPPATIGRRLKDAVREATGGLTVSVGMSATKYVAKVASDFDKPDGLTIVPADRMVAWLAPLPVNALWGAGPKLTARLNEAGYSTIGDIARVDRAALEARFGRIGMHLHALANAEDPRAVEGSRTARSIGSERTLETDVDDAASIRFHLRNAADEVGRRLRRKGVVAGGVRVKLKRADFRLLSRQTVLPEPTNMTQALVEAAVQLADGFAGNGPYRLIGLAAYALEPAAERRQIELGFGETGRARELDAVLDRIATRFGPGSVLRASELAHGTRAAIDFNLDFLDGAFDDES